MPLLIARSSAFCLDCPAVPSRKPATLPKVPPAANIAISGADCAINSGMELYASPALSYSAEAAPIIESSTPASFVLSAIAC